ncbi:MAG: 2-octaprenyl-6-methoxyphenyl hydroxylase [Gammaproteobacteria bacterium]|nr:2-octaprenyl-6-methoxyphenyl hydroxylase [Gammaproteobacteria bacterium]
MSDESYDIVIVGGGLVGNSLALALAQSSLQIAVVEAIDYEQKTEISIHSISSCDEACAQTSSAVYIPVHEQRDKHTTKSQLERRRVEDNRAIGLSYTSQRILQKLGVWPQIEAKAHPIDSVHISLQGRFGVATISAAEQGLASLGCNIDIHYLQKILAHRVRLEALALYAPYRVNLCHRVEGQWQLTLTNGPIEKKLKARLVVAADGSDSELRRTMGITAQVWDYQQSALVSRLTFSKPLNNRSYERFTPLGLMAILPAGAHEATFIWSTTHDQAAYWQNADEKIVLQQLQNIWGYRLGRLQSASPAVHYPLRRIEANQLYQEGFVLIGNAAQTLHPVAAQGFNLGLRSAMMLAEVLCSAQKGGRDYAEAAILAEYVAKQALDRKQIARFTHFLVSRFAADREFFNQWRPLALCGLEWVPGAKSLLARLGLGGAQKALWV